MRALTSPLSLFPVVFRKIVDFATVVNVATDEERINDSLVEKLKFSQDIKAEFLVIFSMLKVGADMEHRGWSRF